MIKKIKKYFRDLMMKMDRNYNHSQQAREEILILKNQITDWQMTKDKSFSNLDNKVAEISKTLSSIEIEVLMQRSASCNKEFEGKPQL